MIYWSQLIGTEESLLLYDSNRFMGHGSAKEETFYKSEIYSLNKYSKKKNIKLTLIPSLPSTPGKPGSPLSPFRPYGPCGPSLPRLP